MWNIISENHDLTMLAKAYFSFNCDAIQMLTCFLSTYQKRAIGVSDGKD